MTNPTAAGKEAGAALTEPGRDDGVRQALVRHAVEATRVALHEEVATWADQSALVSISLHQLRGLTGLLADDPRLATPHERLREARRRLNDYRARLTRRTAGQAEPGAIAVLAGRLHAFWQAASGAKLTLLTERALERIDAAAMQVGRPDLRPDAPTAVPLGDEVMLALARLALALLEQEATVARLRALAQKQGEKEEQIWPEQLSR